MHYLLLLLLPLPSARAQHQQSAARRLLSDGPKPDRPAAAAAAVEYFVSADSGDDDASGTSKASPFRTLPHAQAMARAAAVLAGGRPVSVTLLGGTYRLNQTLAFDSRDSGTVWQSAPGTSPRITASVSVPLSSFRRVVSDQRIPAAAQGHVMSAKLADVSPGLAIGSGVAGWSFRNPDRLEVYAQQKTLTLARFPNVGASVAGSVFTGFATASAGYSSARGGEGGLRSGGLRSGSAGRVAQNCTCARRFGLCPAPCMPNAKANAVSWADAPGAGGLAGRPERWARTGGTPQLALHGAWRYQWADQQVSVVETNLTNHTFIFDESKSSAMHYWPPQTGAPYYALDLLQELDEAGEWWLDRSARELFLWAPAALGADDHIELSSPLPMAPGALTPANEAVLAKAGPILVLMDSVVDLQWTGISIGQSRGIGMYIRNCTNIMAAKVGARGFSGMAVHVGGGVNVTLSQWHVVECGAGGVLLSGGDRPTLTPCNHSLLDSDISFTDNWVM
jgi:hypothetical protein